MVALDARRLAGTSPLHDQTLDSALCKIHRQAQADGAATDDHHLSLADFAHTESPFMAGHPRDCRFCRSWFDTSTIA